VLVGFVAGAVALTRWLDVQTARGFLVAPIAPSCTDADCGPPDAAPVQSHAGVLAAPLPMVSDVPASPAVLAPSDVGLAEEARRVIDAGPPSDAPSTMALSVGSQGVAPPVGQPAAQQVDASRAAPPNEGGAARTERVEDASQRSGVRCGTVSCPEGQVCCNASCSQCRPPGASCSQVLCGPISPMSVSCGPNTCNVGEVCCNSSCGICTQPGGTCSQQRCEGVQVPVSTPCGRNTCNVGQVCCNASCGICTSPGESCSKEPCS
jgi:hypothetical protein